MISLKFCLSFEFRDKILSELNFPHDSDSLGPLSMELSCRGAREFHYSHPTSIDHPDTVEWPTIIKAIVSNPFHS